mmetsp:Transcript_2170/g.5691  ORF Transcript_2170/g.5691 Transcript_2170/m.5691 type:complete len:724 (-) Transcript_2170:299-2470(-)
MLEEGVLNLANFLIRVVADQSDFVLDIVMKCVRKLGSKVSVYAALVGLINAELPDFGKAAVNAAHAALEDALRDDDLVTLKLVLRFCAELANCGVLYMSGLVGVLNDFAVVMDDSQAHRLKRDASAMLIMGTLPWCCARLKQDKKDDLEDLVAVIKVYMSRRPPVTELLSGTLRILQPFPMSDGPLDQVEEAWALVQALAEARWSRPACLRRGSDENGYGLFSSGPIFGRLSRSQNQHQIPTLRPEQLEAAPRTLAFIPLCFRLLPTLQQVPITARWIVRDHVSDILLYFAGSRDYFPAEERKLPGVGALKGNVLEGAKQILNLPSVPKFEGIVVETIIGEMMRLPAPPHKSVFYASMLVELCKLQSTVAPPIGAAVGYLFDAIGRLQAECLDRLEDWLSFHLSNLEFKWLWGDWAMVSSYPDHHPQKRFVSRLLDRVLRLTYFERVEVVLRKEDAAPLVSLLRRDQSAVYPYEDPSHPLHRLAAELRDRVSLARRDPCEMLQEFVNKSLADLPGPDPSRERTRMLVAAMVFEGRESFSHVLGILGRYLDVLRNALETVEDEEAAVQAVTEVWVKSPQNCVMVMDKLVAMKLVAPVSLVRWLLADYDQCRAREPYMWELLSRAISKPVTLVATVRSDLDAATAELDALRSSAGSDRDPAVQESIEAKENRIDRIRAYLRRSEDEQDRMLVSSLKSLVLLADQCARARRLERRTTTKRRRRWRR